MHPIILRLGPLEIYAYGLMLGIAFVAGVTLAQYLAKKDGENPETLLNMAIIIIIAALVGSKLTYVITTFGTFLDNPRSYFRLRSGGFVMYGGVILSLIAAYLYGRYKKIDIHRYLDYMAPSVAMGIGITRIGCFLSGCCFGKPTDLPFGVTFPPGSIPYDHYGYSCAIHPTQLYSSLNGWMLFVIVMLLWKRRAYPGWITWNFLIMYAITRFLIEFLRGDTIRGFVWLLSTSQWISIFILIVAVNMHLYLRRRYAGVGVNKE